MNDILSSINILPSLDNDTVLISVPVNSYLITLSGKSDYFSDTLTVMTSPLIFTVTMPGVINSI